ncbi:MAG TPA: SsgA family sporulation/cell division regulator [Mycobacteriales bacterium]|nr:SsgA family sporulation/cell division regulator [Mycobacteriales bacterium]
MLHLPRTITTPLALTVSTGTGEAELDAELRYDPADPFAVSLAIGVDCGEPVVWTFARELLADGVNSPSGEGDITIEPDMSDGFSINDRQLRITLATDCMATMLAPADRIVEFLVETFAVVPTGAELDRVDLDAEIAALLA